MHTYLHAWPYEHAYDEHKAYLHTWRYKLAYYVDTYLTLKELCVCKLQHIMKHTQLSEAASKLAKPRTPGGSKVILPMHSCRYIPPLKWHMLELVVEKCHLKQGYSLKFPRSPL